MTKTPQKMPPMQEVRESLRFTQNETNTYHAVTNADAPEWQREFVRFMWYGRIPTTIWNDQYLKLPKAVALKLINGYAVPLDEKQIETAVYLTQAVQKLINKGVLPCADKRALSGVFRLGIDIMALEYHINNQQTVGG